MAAALSYIFLCLIWGSTWLAIRIGLSDMPPFWSLAIRQVIAVLFLLSISLKSRSDYAAIRKHLGLILVIGFLTHPLSYSLVYWGEQYVSSGLSAVLFSGMPFFVAIFSWWLLPNERVTPLSAVGLVLGFSGLAVIYWEHLNMGGTNMAIGMTCIIISGMIAALTTITVKKYLSDTPALSLATVTVAVGAITMPVAALATERIADIQWGPLAVGAVVYLGIFGSGVTFVLYYRLLSRLPALTMSLIAFMTPIVALVLGAFFDKEAFTLRSWLGTGMVLVGVLLAALKTRTSFRGARTR